MLYTCFKSTHLLLISWFEKQHTHTRTHNLILIRTPLFNQPQKPPAGIISTGTCQAMSVPIDSKRPLKSSLLNPTVVTNSNAPFKFKSYTGTLPPAKTPATSNNNTSRSFATYRSSVNTSAASKHNSDALLNSLVHSKSFRTGKVHKQKPKQHRTNTNTNLEVCLVIISCPWKYRFQIIQLKIRNFWLQLLNFHEVINGNAIIFDPDNFYSVG
jgi:hypothetical protein